MNLDISIPRPEPSVWLRRFTKAVAASTLFLIFAGAMVTSTGSGLAVPDWPLSYGMLLPPMVGGIFYEHGHRMIAATVGALTVIQAIWLQMREPRKKVRLLGWASVGAVIAQGLLGGLTVLFFLPPAISIAHAGLAEIFFCMNVTIAFLMSAWFCPTERVAAQNLPSGTTTVLTLFVYAQILVGALMRHLGAGLAIPDFPLAFGRLIPEMTSPLVAINFTHRVGALIVAGLALTVSIQLTGEGSPRAPRRLSRLLLAVIGAQILLGGVTVLSGKHPLVTSLHVMTGALTLAVSLLLCLSTRRVMRLQERDRDEAMLISGVTA